MRSFRKIFASEFGGGLMTVMVAMGVMGGIGAMMMLSSEESNKAMKSNFITEDMNNMSAQIARLLSSSEACGLTFNGKNARNSPPVTDIKDHSGVTVLSTATKFGTGNISFESVRLQDPNSADDDVQVVTGGTGSTYAVVKFNKVQKSLFAQRNQIVKIRLKVVTNAADAVTACFAVNANDSLWAREAPTDNINYSPGNVGVGLMAPTQKLDVSGASYTPPKRQAVVATTPDGKKFSIGGTATEYQLNVNDDLPVVVKGTTGAELGTIVVNKATASESFILKPVATSTIACGPAYEGAIRSKEIVVRPVAFRGENALTLLRTQVCSDYGGLWKWRTLRVQKFTRASGSPCTPSQAQRDCTDHNNSATHQ